MDSHSRSASPREPMRPQIRPPSPPSPAAFDNRAYQHDESDPNHNESFTSNGPANGTQQNGHKPNGDTKLEAVNLELINLTPKNGTKKDTAVDMNASNPYDEYFVPVNEHRKFMRGEKLYVTADKRGEKGGCKRPLCWTLLVLVVAAIVAVIVLAATGVLFSGSPSALEQYNATISSARAFGGVVHDHDHDHSGHDHSGHDHSGHDHSGHDHDSATEPAQTQHGPETQNDEANVHTPGSDESDMSMYVPRTLEGELKIDNEEYSPALADTDSDEYREFVSSFTEALKRAVFDRNTLENGDNDVTVEVIQLRQGSVVVTYRIHWTPKLNAAPTADLLTADTLKTKLDDYLERNNRMINVYHVAEEKTNSKHVLDICQIDNNQCDHGCEFDETTLEFTCTCPHGQMLDIHNPKQCMSILENSYPMEPTGNKNQEFNKATVNANPSTTKPIPDEETPAKEEVHIVNEHFDWKETNHATPKTTTESEADMNFSHIFGHGENEHKTEKPVPEPNAEPEPTAEPKAEPEPSSEPEAKPEPSAEPAAEPEAEPAAEPTAEPTAEPEPEPASAAEPTSSENEHNLEVIPSSIAEPASEPTSEPAAKPTPEPEPESEPKVKTESESFAEPKPEPEPTSEPESELKSEPEPEPKSEPEPEPNAETEPKSEREPTSEPAVSVEPTTMKVSIAEVVPTSEPEPIPSESSSEISEPKQNTEHESSSDEKPTLFTNEEKYDTKFTEEMDTSTTRVSISEPNIINEPSYEPKPEIVSIYSKQGPVPTFVAADNSETTTEINEWLEDRTVLNEKQSVVEHETPKNGESEQRSFKSIDIFGEEPTSTTKIESSVDEVIVPSDIMGKDDKTEVFTNAPPGSKQATTMKTNYMEETTDNDIAINEHNIQVLTTEMPTTNNDEESPNPFTNVNNTTTLEPKSEDEHSIVKQTAKSNEEKRLMDALSKKEVLETDSTTESRKSDEGMDITFDTINNLYNRSSKSIENQTESKQEPTDSMINDIAKAITTESDWLSEPVTEMNFEEAMNKLEKHETTEAPATKFEEIINGGKTKDDFEPDYLNNMSSNNKMSEQDEPMYGLAQDYDSEDARVKRVNTEKQITTEAPIKEESSETLKKTATETPVPVDATTIVEYIYKSAETTTPNNVLASSSTQAPLSEDAKPAPVWEESESDLTVKELPKLNPNEETTTTRVVMIGDIVVPWELSSTTTTTVTETTSSQATEVPSSSAMPESSTSSNIQKVSSSDTESQNTTQVNNLNVTIYEISSHNNSSGAVKDGNAQATDFEDHETEMNPFLPEAENNKVLVKKLQEGHDIEPNNLTETQNENTEEHSNVSEATANQVVADNKAVSTKAPITTEDYATFNELMKSPQENKTQNSEIVAVVKSGDSTAEHKEALPISTFLLDTDDLDIGKDHTNDHKTTIAVNNLETVTTASPSIAEDSEYLSVVPIEEERLEEKDALKKSYSSESMQELNDISDSPKKSDRRTLDETKFDSVNNNEA